jgi:P27 family predicted phage terminase small subunit
MTQRKPTKLKKLAGTHRPDRDPEHEPEPEPGPVSMPRGVLPRSARKMWREWAPELQRLGLLTPMDGPMFTLLCTWAGIAVDAAALIREAEEAPGAEQGLVTNDDRDRARKNRALTVLRAASTELRQLSASFGLTPADRAGLDVPGQDEPTLREELELVLRSRKVSINDEDS